MVEILGAVMLAAVSAWLGAQAQRARWLDGIRRDLYAKVIALSIEVSLVATDVAALASIWAAAVGDGPKGELRLAAEVRTAREQLLDLRKQHLQLATELRIIGGPRAERWAQQLTLPNETTRRLTSIFEQPDETRRTTLSALAEELESAARTHSAHVRTVIAEMREDLRIDRLFGLIPTGRRAGRTGSAAAG